jgi:Heterokaryon incompatibility protein (HET)
VPVSKEHAAAGPTLLDWPMPSSEELKRNRKLRYNPLQIWQNGIINLLPRRFEEPLDCDLLTAELIYLPGPGIPQPSTIKGYVALYYSRGKPELDAPIRCNALPVLTNGVFSEALRYLPKADAPVLLWCDAIVVDQENLVEKAL